MLIDCRLEARILFLDAGLCSQTQPAMFAFPSCIDASSSFAGLLDKSLRVSEVVLSPWLLMQPVPASTCCSSPPFRDHRVPRSSCCLGAVVTVVVHLASSCEPKQCRIIFSDGIVTGCYWMVLEFGGEGCSLQE